MSLPMGTAYNRLIVPRDQVQLAYFKLKREGIWSLRHRFGPIPEHDVLVEETREPVEGPDWLIDLSLRLTWRPSLLDIEVRDSEDKHLFYTMREESYSLTWVSHRDYLAGKNPHPSYAAEWCAVHQRVVFKEA